MLFPPHRVAMILTDGEETRGIDATAVIRTFIRNVGSNDPLWGLFFNTYDHRFTAHNGQAVNI